MHRDLSITTIDATEGTLDRESAALRLLRRNALRCLCWQACGEDVSEAGGDTDTTLVVCDWFPFAVAKILEAPRTALSFGGRIKVHRLNEIALIEKHNADLYSSIHMAIPVNLSNMSH